MHPRYRVAPAPAYPGRVSSGRCCERHPTPIPSHFQAPFRVGFEPGSESIPGLVLVFRYAAEQVLRVPSSRSDVYARAVA